MSRMKGRVVIVTGASDGIGKVTSIRLANEGAHVVLAARGADRLNATAAQIEAAGGSAETAVVDITDGAALDHLIASVAERHGRLDGLVNNAATVTMGPLTEIDESTWRATFAGGVDAVFVGTRAALRAMLPRRSGSIVNISSSMGIRAAPAMGAYSASKAAIIQLTRVAAIESAAQGVRVNAVAPGVVLTPGTEAYFNAQPEMRRQTESGIPLGRAARAEEVANAILFLLSDEATYITGVCLDVDGGKMAQL